MAYGVWCEVSGGVTGPREAWLKDGNGEVVVFEDPAEATTTAEKLTVAHNHANSKARFRYSARKLLGGVDFDQDDDEDELEAPM